MCTTVFRLITDYTFSMLAFLSRMPVRNKALNSFFRIGYFEHSHTYVYGITMSVPGRIFIFTIIFLFFLNFCEI